jgi:PIN domain nuclease of toxin-antitoxin system
MIFLDTSALIFWTLFPERLSANAAKVIQEAQTIQICSISIWEIGIKMKKGHLVLPSSLPDFVGRLEKTLMLDIVPVDVPIWLESLSLAWDHQDPADRVIVACAQLQTCSLLTSDRKIAEFYPHTVW